jgi:hypothetical protein
MEPLEPAALDGVRDLVRELSGSRRAAHFPIVGLCARCAKKRRGSASAANGAA